MVRKKEGGEEGGRITEGPMVDLAGGAIVEHTGNKRFTPYIVSCGDKSWIELWEDPNGEWVQAKEYDKLLTRIAELEDEIEDSGYEWKEIQERAMDDDL